jgi:CBS domain-containing protein
MVSYLKVRDLMKKDVITAGGDISVKSAIEILHKKHSGSIIIVDEERRCKGIFTERDAIRLVAGDMPLNTPIRNVMTSNPITVHEEATFAESMALIMNNSIRHLPVVDKEECLTGLFSIRLFLDEILRMK